jgi:ribosomal protein S18 acetylase RimI-like enzyme
VTAGQVPVSAVSAAYLPALIALLRAIEAERLPADRDASERAEAEVRLSLSRFDFTQSHSCRMLLATVGGDPAGYALVVRIPKPDGRVGLLFVEELYVLSTYRRVGVASALLRACENVAREWGLHGVRLLVRPENDAARKLYRSAGFAESTTAFCEKILS